MVFYVVSQLDASGEQGDVAQTSASTVAGSVVTPVARSRAASQNS